MWINNYPRIHYIPIKNYPHIHYMRMKPTPILRHSYRTQKKNQKIWLEGREEREGRDTGNSKYRLCCFTNQTKAKAKVVLLFIKATYWMEEEKKVGGFTRIYTFSFTKV